MPKNKYALSDETWDRIRQFVPPRKNTHPRGGGRKPKDDRLVYESILFVLRFGCQWEALNATGLAPSSTVHDRFRKWVDEGFFHTLMREGLLEKGIDWSWLTAGSNPETSGPPTKRMRRTPVRPRQEWRPKETLRNEEPMRQTGYRTKSLEQKV